MIVIVDYGAGNLGSILNMLKKAGFTAKVSADPAVIAEARKLILPGVGAFDYGMQRLQASGLTEALNRKVLEEKIPVLGICLGMQLMAASSEEGSEKGLGWLDARCVKFHFDSADSGQAGLKVPHMGWDEVQISDRSGVFREMYDQPRFYFVHSYHLDCADPADIAATSVYGYEFTCAVRKGNIQGVQFHPEKSHKFGLQLLKNFAKE